MEEQMKRLSGSGHTFREGTERHPLPGIEERRIDRKIKHHAAVRRHFRNEAQSGHAGFARQIRRHPQPGEERRGIFVESGRRKPIGQRLLFEVDGHEGQRRWNRNACRLQLFTLPSLSGGVIHFEYPQAWVRIAIGKGIQSSAQHHVLRDTIPYRAGEFVLGVAAARRHERTECTGKRVVLSRIGSQLFLSFKADDAQSQRIVENPGLVQKLVRSPANRHPLRGFAECAFLHVQIR